jgi:hypothetical protein
MAPSRLVQPSLGTLAAMITGKTLLAFAIGVVVAIAAAFHFTATV